MTEQHGHHWLTLEEELMICPICGDARLEEDKLGQCWWCTGCDSDIIPLPTPHLVVVGEVRLLNIGEHNES